MNKKSRGKSSTRDALLVTYIYKTIFWRNWKKPRNMRVNWKAMASSEIEVSQSLIHRGYQSYIDPSLQWRHNGRDGVSNHRPRHCLLNRLFRSKKTSKLRVTGLCVGNSPVTSEFPAQMASNTENVSIWWCHWYIVGTDTNMGDWAT